MKKLLFILILAPIISFGQLVAEQMNYGRLAFEVGAGGHLIADQSGVLDGNFIHMNFIGRYSFNNAFSLGGVYAFDGLDFTKGESSWYERFTIEAFADVMDIVDLDNKHFSLLAHGGAGMATFDGNYFGAASAGLTGLFNISRTFAVKADFTTVGNFAQDVTLNQLKATTNAGINSIIYNFSVGLVVYPLKSSQQRHYDFYTKQPDFIRYETIIYKQNPYVPTKEDILPLISAEDLDIKFPECDCAVREFVLFDHDKSDLTPKTLNAILKVYNYAVGVKYKEIQINGFASATAGTADYNLALSERRVNTVAQKLIDMGVDASKIKTSAKGKDYNWKEIGLHDVSRRVEIIVK